MKRKSYKKPEKTVDTESFILFYKMGRKKRLVLK